LNVILNVSDEDSMHPLPDVNFIQKVANICFKKCTNDLPIELGITNVSSETITEINHQYRQRNKATNVLTFVFDEPIDNHHYLGDVLCCGAVIEREAKEAQVDPLAHWAHMIIHSCLHILGYTHDDDKNERLMQAEEVSLLKLLGIKNPYLGQPPQ
jgi:probable rRNA maturation factor